MMMGILDLLRRSGKTMSDAETKTALSDQSTNQSQAVDRHPGSSLGEGISIRSAVETSPDNSVVRQPRRVGVRRFFIPLCFLAVLGGLVLIGLAVSTLRLDVFGRAAADRILANAILPAGREMPSTAGAIPYGSSDIQILGGMGQGLSCSLPTALEWLAFPSKNDYSPIGLRMRQACAYHDYCYRHGAATYGYTQADCDFSLQVQAFRLCAFIERAVQVDADGQRKVSECTQDARLVTLGVRIGGSDSFRTLDTGSVPTAGQEDHEGTRENSSTYFEFDPYPTKSNSYTVYRIADAPPGAAMPLGTKAIYQFNIKPSGIAVSYSVGSGRYKEYAQIPGNPGYLTTAPLVVQARSDSGIADWFVWWQRVSEEVTTGRLVALAPGSAPRAAFECFSLRAGCSAPASHSVVARIGKKHDDDPLIGQLLPADGHLAPDNSLSLVTLRNHSCIEEGNGKPPCFIRIQVKTDLAADAWQPQEPLSINDRLSPKSAPVDHDRYRNFASLPFVLEPPDLQSPVIIWTRRDQNYKFDAFLRSAAVNPGNDPESTSDDTAISRGTVLLSGFGEAEEPGFIIGRASAHPILASITDMTGPNGKSALALQRWPLPQADIGDGKADMPSVSADPTPCFLDLESGWLSRPSQVVDRPGGTTLAVFTRLRPNVSKDWTSARLQVATVLIKPDGSCPAPVWKGSDVTIATSKPASPNDEQDPIVRGKGAFVRISRAPIIIADLDHDGSMELILSQGATLDVPQPICRITTSGTCV
ncbi:hypothetical protein ELI20_37215 [Rhizobium ruizarguesonis]|uniref:hypothetical protein n=1 Tax=Rhizobium ruizarguesonis TaxID=2081791 RepID=UPI001031FCB2|nr:hypothetical protein [Rhizobium ruizarguesonis]TAW03848.1 hypothetical protein ELI20_37215 [Rhizobium ruizarguesonis]